MSIINDALKKAERNKELLQNKLFQIHRNIDSLKRREKRLKKWVVAVTVGTASFVMIFFVLNYLGVIVNPFKSILASNSLDEAILEVESKTAHFQETPPEAESSESMLGMRKIDYEAPLQLSNFRLSGILYDEQRPLAIINNQVVEEGALINEAELLEIQKGYVKLSLQGKEFRLQLY